MAAIVSYLPLINGISLSKKTRSNSSEESRRKETPSKIIDDERANERGLIFQWFISKFNP